MDSDESALAQMLQAWLNAPTFREERRFLEAHLALLEPASSMLLERVQRRYRASAQEQFDALRPAIDAVMAQAAPLSDDLWERLLSYGRAMDKVDSLGDCLRLLDDIRNRGGDAQAVCDAYVNAHGGMSLDIPVWLEDIESHLIELKASGPPYATSAERVLLLRSVLTQAESDLAPEIAADVRIRLRRAINDGLIADREPAVAQDEAIQLLKQALPIYTEQRFPHQFANIQNNLGNAYRNRVAGERSVNLERAIAAYEAALRVYTLDRFPRDYASLQNNLGNAYCTRIAGEKSKNLERAIAAYEAALRVYTLDRFPRDYASLQNNLGNAYSDRMKGEMSENLERAIAAYERALSIRTFERAP